MSGPATRDEGPSLTMQQTAATHSCLVSLAHSGNQDVALRPGCLYPGHQSSNGEPPTTCALALFSTILNLKTVLSLPCSLPGTMSARRFGHSKLQDPSPRERWRRRVSHCRPLLGGGGWEGRTRGSLQARIIAPSDKARPHHWPSGAGARWPRIK
ncbi:hypothetical protein GQ53DRAFT_440188 [Thozetella sp. PMI_491]|nr:hypothetical protein GQ53DRAFT_440188 [Thozetella sp. PMI_491]